MKYKRMNFILLAVILGSFIWIRPVEAAESFSVTGKCVKGQKVILNIIMNGYNTEVAGFEIYRADSVNGLYQYIDNVDLLNSEYDSNEWYDDYESNSQYFYTDNSELLLYHTYYYQIRAYQFVENTKVYIQTVNIGVTILEDGPTVTYSKRNGKLGSKLKWTKVEGADGYLIYCVKNYDDRSNYVNVNLEDESQYTLVKTINGADKVSTSFKNLKNGVTYHYRIYSYKKINGKRIMSISSDPCSIVMNYYSYDSETYAQRIKRAFGSSKAKKKNFKTASKAGKQMKRIKIKVWDYKKGKKGKKITKTKWLTVNKRMAPSIKQMFNELYKSKEKQVIHDIGCYSYRTGEHMYGLAIDINPNENYMIDGKKVMAGSFWKPKKNPYSIPKNCEFVRIMRRYGFYRGEWGKRKDYMHFSYFGT